MDTEYRDGSTAPRRYGKTEQLLKEAEEALADPEVAAVRIFKPEFGTAQGKANALATRALRQQARKMAIPRRVLGRGHRSRGR